MIMQEVAIREIDVECEDFRISEELASARLVDSLRVIGQLNPVILLRRDSRLVTICGFRRIHILRQLGNPAVVARILTETDDLDRHPLELALRDNLAHRELGPLEQARAVVKLQKLCDIPQDRILREYFPLLGLPRQESVLSGCAALDAAQPSLRRLLAEGVLTFSSTLRLARLSPEEQDRFAALMNSMRLSASSQKKMLELLDDIVGINGTTFTEPLYLPEVRELLQDTKLTPFQKGEKLYGVLYRLRYPRLTKALARFDTQRQQLKLPGEIHLSPHPYFETADMRIDFSAATLGKFQEFADELQKAAHSPAMEELFRISADC